MRQRPVRTLVRQLFEPSRRISRWVVVVLAAAVVLTPAAAVAATLSGVQLVGSSGAPAMVTHGGQVETAATNPLTFRAFHNYDVFGSECLRVFTPPPGYAFVLQSVTVDVYDTGGVAGPGSNVRIATDPACDDEFVDLNPADVGATSIVLNSGIVIRAGASLYAIGDNGTDAELYGFGYLEPAADAPVGTTPQSDDAAAPRPETPAHVARTPLTTQLKGRARP